MVRSFKSRGPSPFLKQHEGITKNMDVPFLGTSEFKHSFEVSTGKIRSDPEQSRKHFSEEEIKSLADSIQSKGLLQPVLLRSDPDHDGNWIIVAGEKRYRAVVSLGMQQIIAIEYDGDYISANLIENIQRSDLSAVETALGIKNLMAHHGWSQSEAARQLSIGQPRVNRLIKILDLPDHFLKEAAQHRIPENTLIIIAREENKEKRDFLIRKASQGDLTVANAKTFSVSENKKNKEQERKNLTFSTIMKKTIKATETLIAEIGREKNLKNKITEKDRIILIKTRDAINDLLS